MTDTEHYQIRLKLLGFKDYKSYTQSDLWQQIRRQFIGTIPKRKRQCAICNKRYKLEVHHRRYGNLGQENMQNDLVLLCGPCHIEVHELLRSSDKYSLHNAHRSLMKLKHQAKMKVVNMWVKYRDTKYLPLPREITAVDNFGGANKNPSK